MGEDRPYAGSYSGGNAGYLRMADHYCVHAEGDLVLDPFFGTGTTGAVAKKLGRDYIGLEREESYIKVAEQRLRSITKLGDDEILHAVSSKREEPRIPFGTLIESGLLDEPETQDEAE